MAIQDTKTFLDWHFSDLNHISFQIQGRALFLVVIFFSIIILISLLFFFINRVCPHNLFLPTYAVAIIRSEPRVAAVVLTRSLGLDAAAINSLLVVLHSSLANNKMNSTPTNTEANDQRTECCICLSLFEDEEMVKVLPVCHHAYHSVCVDKWLSTQSSCPLCRASLRVDILDESTIP